MVETSLRKELSMPALAIRKPQRWFAAAAFLAFALLAGPAMAAEKFKAVMTFTVNTDIARNVAGAGDDAVESITKPGAEIHDYQPTPGNIRRAQDAQLMPGCRQPRR